jgi:hypothetical protein
MDAAEEIFRHLDVSAPPVAIISHRRSGTHLTIDLLRRQFPGTSPRLLPLETPHHLYLDMDGLRPNHHNPITPRHVLKQLRRAERCVIKTHCLPDDSGSLPEFGPNAALAERLLSKSTKFYVVRDGRKVISSQHIYEQTYRVDALLSLDEFLRSEFNGLTRPLYWALHADRWTCRDDVTTFRFEDITTNTRDMIVLMGSILGLTPRFREPLLPSKLADTRLGRLWPRLIGSGESTTVTGRPAKNAQPLNWETSLSELGKKYYEELAGPTHLRLGYTFNKSISKP